MPDGADYDLQVSLENHPTARFQFTPNPVIETGSVEAADNTFYNLDDPKNWYKFFQPDVGNGTSINSTVPYVIVQGAGDWSWDVYQFEVTQAMLDPIAATVTGTPAAGLLHLRGHQTKAGARAHGRPMDAPG